MSNAHYLIFHPANQREKVKISATVLRDNRPEKWSGEIWVDRLSGNEDPFVFVEPWRYSYCHASQLRRKKRETGAYLKRNSILIFCCGDAANNGHLTVDTVFVIEAAREWSPKPNLALPPEYKMFEKK